MKRPRVSLPDCTRRYVTVTLDTINQAPKQRNGVNINIKVITALCCIWHPHYGLIDNAAKIA